MLGLYRKIIGCMIPVKVMAVLSEACHYAIDLMTHLTGAEIVACDAVYGEQNGVAHTDQALISLKFAVVL